MIEKGFAHATRVRQQGSNLGGTTDYVDGIQYTGGSIDFIQTEEGRAVNQGGTYKYEYNLSDHLGNVRYSFDIYAGAVRKLQEDNYYAFGLRNSASAGTNNYLYNGKELQDELGQYDYGARFYDPVVGRFNTLDPLSEKSRRFSPYSYAVNNPIRFIDVDGMYAFEPTPEEAALMSKDVYGGKDRVTLKGGWARSNLSTGLNYENEKTGFKSALYERKIDGKIEYTYATAGTDPDEMIGNDGVANVKQLVGVSEQYKQSTKNAKALSNQLGDAELTFTGHSLGGGLAESNSIATGDKAITFNAAGLSPFTKGFGSGNVKAYAMKTDPLTIVQDGMLILPNSGGTRHTLTPKSASGVYNGHSIDSVIESFAKPSLFNMFLKSAKDYLTKPVRWEN